jgi:hypothetical protein
MSAGIEIYNYVSNQKGTPALYSDILANRPAAGFLGRLFISTDTLEIYRDTGTAWALISGGGGSVNIYNSDGTLTAARTMTMSNHSLTFEGGANDARLIMSANNNVPRIFSFRTANVARWDFRVTDNETGSDAGGNWYLRAHNDAGAFTFAPIAANRKTGEKTLFAQANITAGTEAVTSVFNIAGITYASGLTMIGGNAHAAQFNNFTLANSGSLTFANSSFVGANGNVLRLQANNSGTITMQAATPGLRTAAVSLNQIQYNTTNGSSITYTHAANIQGLGILQLFAAGSLTVTNAYGLLLNDLNEYGYPSTGAGALSITNRWGIYQDSTTDVNYLGGSVLIGTTTNAGFKTDINGTFRAVSTVTLSSLGGVGTRMVVADASGVLSTQAIPGGGGGITGSGTTNFVAKFTGASSIGNSLLQDNGTNVGVNTAPTTTKFTVSETANSWAAAFIAPSSNELQLSGNITSNNNAPTIRAVTSGGAAYTSLTLDGSYIDFKISGTSQQRIFTSGNVAIGTTTDAGYKFQVNGTSQFRSNIYFPSNVWNFDAAGVNRLFFSAASTTIFGSPNGYEFRNNADAGIAALTNAGNLGIGTTVPLAIANYNGVSVSGTNGSFLSLYAGATQGGRLEFNTGADLQLKTLSTQPLILGTNNTTRVTVTGAGGFVGISTTTPSVQLSLGATVGDRLAIYDAGASTLFGFGVQVGLLQMYTPAGSDITFGQGISTALTRRATLFSGGNFAIGTTTDSGQRLQVAGTARIFGTALPHLLIEQTAATGNVELQFTATDASYPAIIRSKAAQSIAFKDGTNSNLDIYSAGQLSIGGGGAPFGSTNTLTVLAGTAPTATASDCFTLYSKDITAGNAAPHFITENGAIVKIYQETTSVAAAAFTANTGTAINDASTFDGYTLRQIVKALRNLGILQ